MKRRIICFVLAMLTLLVIMPSFAATSAQDVNGSCKKTFVSSKSLTINSSYGSLPWISFFFMPTAEIAYTDTGSYSTPTYSGHAYAYARPQGTDGTMYGTQFKVYNGHTTAWIPNSSGASASTIKFKFYNALYNDYNYTTSTMTIEGIMYGIY